MSNTPTNMKFFRYLIESLDILFQGEKEPTKIDTNQITGLTIEKDYDNDFFPVIKLSVTMEPKLYYKIIDKKLSVKFRMRMQKYVYNQIKEFQFKRDVFNNIFSVFIDEDTPFLSEESYKDSKEIEKTSRTPKDLSNEFTFYLFKEDDLTNSKKIINTILSGVTMTDAVSYCLSTSGFTKVLMTPLDNKASYNPVLLPPLTSLGNLIYLEQQYGFHINGSLIFFDIDCAYILDKTPKCTAWRQQEYVKTIFSLKSSDNPDVLSPGSYVDDKEKKYYINITPDSISMTTGSVISDQINGNNLIIINPASGSIQNINSKSVNRGNGTYKILVNKYNNDFINKATTKRIVENANIVNVNIGDFDVEALTPNKEFVFIFENQSINKDYGGSYRITKCLLVFAKQGEEFVITGNCEFKK